MAERVICCFLLFYVNCLAFNVDTNLPIVKTGQKGSYFGYSVIQHQKWDTGTDSITENLLVVGAPLQDLEVKAVIDWEENGAKENVVGHGAIYQCPLTTLQDDCINIPTGEMGYDMYYNVKGEEVENVTAQWLGGSLNRQRTYGSPLMMTCAHRFKKHTPESPHRTNWGFGRCILLNNDFTFNKLLSPCMSRSVKNGQMDYGYCMSGTIGIITDNAQVLIGAPGALNYRGVLYRYDGSFFTHTPIKESPVAPYSYMGFSSTSGFYAGKKGNLIYVGGAPHGPETGSTEISARNNGEVLLFSDQPGGVDSLDYQKGHVLVGEELGSMFGYSLCTEDVNNDGYDDLLVGAPFLYKRNEFLGGAVYVYYGSDKGITSKTEAHILFSRKMEERECEQLGCTHAQFGHGITSLGDINRDGFKDIAISAPYEGDGTVYIYHGSKDGIIPQYSQRITPSNLNITQKLTTFGTSINGGLDLDNNGYPDLLIGSYESDTAVLLRSRPIIKLHSKVDITPKKINPLDAKKGCQFDNTKNRQCIQLELCLSFTTDPPKK